MFNSSLMSLISPRSCVSAVILNKESDSGEMPAPSRLAFAKVTAKLEKYWASWSILNAD